MAIGDAASAAGMDLVPDTDDRRNGYAEINKTRDYIAEYGSDAANLTGTAPATVIPPIDASKIASGTINGYRIPDLPASKIASGTINASRLPASMPGATAGFADGPSTTAYARDVGSGRFAVWMDSDYNFGRNVSSRRYKDDIQPAAIDVAAVLALEPVTYHLKRDPAGVRDLGLIAEDSTDVEHLVVYDVPRNTDGKPRKAGKPRPETVRYEQALPVALLAVVKHQAQQIVELEARIARLEQA